MEYYNGSNNKPSIEEYEGYEERTEGKDYKLLDEIKIAVSIPSRLKEMMEVSKKSFIKYVACISVFAAVIIYLIPFAATVAGFGGFRTLFTEKWPAFRYENRTLNAEKKFDMMLSGYHLYMDTSQRTVDPATLPSNGIYITFGSEKMTFVYVEKSAVKDFSTVLYEMDNSALFTEGMNNETFANSSLSFYITGILMTIIMALVVAVKYLFLALLYTAIMMIPYKLFIKNIYTDEAFKISYYAQTIGIFIVSVNKAAGFLLPEMLVSVVGIFITLRFIKYTLGYNGDNENGD